ncbi:S-DNA-T family DNA segregation ATPase FtsK/SpoIIIE [Entomoplasma freundtii]|uniref:DNA translocase n=1 Tax=Entomoplasma freundtii TaxID=74700 RepID=A0A2K8NS03_9MOLU|nr:DNA translocase FtsK [Entomoplasma freundtii]ATZ16557.1 DNA translocase [Entomoplasma freundtii]TDY58277.1 S-DNA-T family DNA segregation ATPase FtsK/SpoIIIE [Entomoplasma freundtii]
MSKKSLFTTDTFEGNQIYAPHDFNEERTMVFTTLKKQHQKDSIGWLIAGLLLFFFTMLSAGRLTIVGQFFDDAIFNLIFGWFKFPVYLLLLGVDLAIYFGVRFKFKKRFLAMIACSSALLCWGISLILFTYIYDQGIMFHDTTIKGLWSKTFFPDSFKIYWFNWLDNSIFGAQYAETDKMDFLICARGYVTLYAGGGLLGTFIASSTAYLSIPGAFAVFAIVTFLLMVWVLTGDVFYLFKPKHKRRGKALRILSLKAKNNPNKLKKKVKTPKPNQISVESTAHHNQAVDQAIVDSDLTIKMPSYQFNTHDEIADLQKVAQEAQVFNSLTDDIATLDKSTPATDKSRSFPIFEPRRLRPEAQKTSPKTFPHFEKLTKEWQNQMQEPLEEKMLHESQELKKNEKPSKQNHQAAASPLIYQSRRALTSKENDFTKVSLSSEIPFSKMHAKQESTQPIKPIIDKEDLTNFDGLSSEEAILNPMPIHGQYGDLDPLKAREIFSEETKITPFGFGHGHGHQGVSSDQSEVERKEEPNIFFNQDDEVDFLKTLYATVNEETIDVSDLLKEAEHEINFKSNRYTLPSQDLLQEIGNQVANQQKNDLMARENATKIDQVFEQFGVKAKVVKWMIGPSVTKFEIQAGVGTKVSAFTALENDLKLALASTLIRLETPIPGKNLIGLEIPNQALTKVSLKEIITTIPPTKTHHKLLFVLGKKVSGDPLTANLESMPHLLIAGSTGSGKSMMINSLIISLLMRTAPDEVRFLMIDPKRVELAIYSQIPHILTPVINRPKEAAYALQELVEVMEERYDKFAKVGARNIESYNRKLKPDQKKLPFIVVIIDELADLMAGDERKVVEEAIMRLAQMARAAGIHLVLATQRPSVDVLTGTIKTNVPTRIAFSVSSSIDSRTIIDFSGAEKLIGRGDMLFVYPGSKEMIRAQGAYLTDNEIEDVVAAVCQQGEPQYDIRYIPGPETEWKNNS